jgi:hypothetical protein
MALDGVQDVVRKQPQRRVVLVDAILRAGAQDFASHGLVGDAGYDDDRNVWLCPQHGPKRCQTGRIWEVEIENDHIRSVVGQHAVGFAQIAGTMEVEIVFRNGFQQSLHELDVEGVVLDHEHDKAIVLSQVSRPAFSRRRARLV